MRCVSSCLKIKTPGQPLRLAPLPRQTVLGWEDADGFWDGLPLKTELAILAEHSGGRGR